MTCPPSPPSLRLRLLFDGGDMLGPGKAELLERIGRTGSIAAAGREMGMSYKRAWMLIETMNTMFRDPVVISKRGGSKGGGATLTPAGSAVITAYRSLETDATEAGAAQIATLQAMMRRTAEEK